MVRLGEITFPLPGNNRCSRMKRTEKEEREDGEEEHFLSGSEAAVNRLYQWEKNTSAKNTPSPSSIFLLQISLLAVPYISTLTHQQPFVLITMH